VWDAFGVREALEAHAVEQAIKLAGSKDLKALKEKRHIDDQYRPHYYTRKKFLLDSEFHVQIAAISKNRVLKWLLKRNYEHIFLRARLENFHPQRMLSSSEEHQRLIQSMKKKDIIGSLEIIKNHIQKERDYVIRCLTENESEEVEYL
jgi:DNA-binding GntR family transcriptional regulator